MKKYRVNGQGYGGGGPSVTPFESSDINEIQERIEELINSDHAVQLYRINDDGTVKRLNFEYYTSVTVEIKE